MLTAAEHLEMWGALITMGAILFLSLLRAFDGKRETPLDAANRRRR